MPAIYQRKTTRQSWNPQNMLKAIEAVQSGKCGYLKAAKQFDVPKSTLERRCKDKNKRCTGHVQGLGSRTKTFSPELEKQLVDYVNKMEEMLFGLTMKDVKTLAFQFAEKNNLVNFFNKEKQMAGYGWLKAFMLRNNLTLRLPEATSAARGRAFNKNSVGAFFTLLEEIQDKHKFPASRIFNVDETGMSTVQSRPSKIIALCGKKQVGAITSAERGILCTVEICMSAAGTFIPPLFIFPRVRMKAELMNGAPPDSISLCHPSGWMQKELFSEWFDHFLKYTHASNANPALLILDGHTTHTKNLSFIDKARENGVVVLCFPPHCTHRMQPLDVSFMLPLSTYYNQEIEKWLRNHPGRVVTVFQVAEIFGRAYLRAATPLTAIAGFSKCGIVPLNRDIFNDSDFQAAETTDQPLTSCQENEDKLATIRSTPHISVVEESQIKFKGIGLHNPPSSQTENTEVYNGAIPSTSRAKMPSPCVSPQQISPYPKADPKNPRRTTKTRTGKAAVLTSSPFKVQLEEDQKMKNNSALGKIAAPNRQMAECSRVAPVKSAGSVKTGKKRKQANDDCNCLYCDNLFSESCGREKWIRCDICHNWAHCECAGVDKENKNFVCEICK